MTDVTDELSQVLSDPAAVLFGLEAEFASSVSSGLVRRR